MARPSVCDLPLSSPNYGIELTYSFSKSKKRLEYPAGSYPAHALQQSAALATTNTVEGDCYKDCLEAVRNRFLARSGLARAPPDAKS